MLSVINTILRLIMALAIVTIIALVLSISDFDLSDQRVSELKKSYPDIAIDMTIPKHIKSRKYLTCKYCD